MHHASFHRFLRLPVQRKALSVFMVFALAGCSSAPAELPESSASPVSEKKETVVSWIKEPSMDYESMSDIQEVPYAISGFHAEYLGYGQEWDRADLPGASVNEPALYNPNTILFEKDGTGIADFNGNVLYLDPTWAAISSNTGSPLSYDSFSGFYYPNGSWTSCKYMSSDFTSTEERPCGGGLGGMTPPVFSDGTTIYTNMDGVASMVDSVPVTSSRMLVPLYTGDPASYDRGKEEGVVILDPNGKPLHSVKTDKSFQHFVNGFITVGNYDVQNRIWSEMSLIRAETGEFLNEEPYEQVKWFEDGYCPVRKDGKWAYIDAAGQQVTDFLFEDASCVYYGTAYVKVNGKYGILDLRKSLADLKKISAENLRNASE